MKSNINYWFLLYCTYNKPSTNLNAIKIWKLGENAAKNPNMPQPPSTVCKTFCRPTLSARKPQKWVPRNIPKKQTVFNKLSSAIVRLSSHFINGSTNERPKFSVILANTLSPTTITIHWWNFPYPRSSYILETIATVHISNITLAS